MTSVNETSRSIVDAAVAAATDAARASVRESYETRAGWLEALAETLDSHAPELIALADDESRLGEKRLTGELARTSAQLRLFASVVREGSFLEATIDHTDPSATPPIPDLRRMLVPLGPVVVFAASNFPFAFSVLGGDTASALAAGAPVIVKAHEGHPALSRRVAELGAQALEGAGAPSGLLQLVEGREAGVELVRHPDVRAVGFTGSLAGGRHLFDLAVQRPEPIPFYGELASINPVVVTPGAVESSIDEIVDGLLGSFTMGVGQFCTKPGVVLSPAGADLAGRLATKVDADAAGDPASPPMLNDRIRAGFHDRLSGLAGQEGVDVVAGADVVDSEERTSPVVLRTTVQRVLESPEVLLEEVFGPATLIVDYDSEEDVRAALGVLPGSLTATLHAAPGEELARTLVPALGERAGRVLFGGWPTGVAVSHGQHHGGPYPSTTSIHTSVGTTAIRRWLRPVTYQTTPDDLLPEPLQEANPLGIPRRVDGQLVLADHA
ncbi:aldehyde dehydrogenase (NADP(+)) [Georgenia sp. Z1491]|uniref:aldehyde dehydrogenase (NADP(+)) n=1 Tax=Georgenia sp. Z1491 TaxID=3416707 RepID=UPI003CF9FAB3